MDDYYAWSALFARIDYKLVDNKRGDKLDLNEYNGEQLVIFTSQGEVKDPHNGQDVPPKFLCSKVDRAVSEDRL